MDLDSSIDAYKKEFKYDFDNEIILNYYPERVIQRINKGSFLELGLGHGHTIKKFYKNVITYTIIEGSKAIIDGFQRNEPDLYCKINIMVK